MGGGDKMQHGVKIVGDGDLPGDVEWMFVKTTDGQLLLCLAYSSAGSPRVLAEAWAAYRAIVMLGTVPTQRPAVAV